MMPLSPGANSLQQAKTSTHAAINQRQSINEGLMQANGQNKNSQGSPVGGSITGS